MSTVSVRIRNADEAKASPLTEWPMAELDGLIRVIRSWGIESAEGSADVDNLFGQFVVRDGEAFFELVFGEEE